MKGSLFIGANWKMNPPPKGAFENGSPFHSSGDPEIVVFPMFIDLQNCIRSEQIIVGAQCGRAEPSGAYTGDMSMQFLKEFGCTYVLCGHSERRQYHHETDEEIAAQFESALSVGLIPILCIGETVEERESNLTKDKLARQVAFLHHVRSPLRQNAGQAPSEVRTCLIAYEPIWAIGSGKTPTPEEAETTHAFIRSLLPNKNIRILYGGSVNAKNIGAFLKEPNIDGALIGGASLKKEEFAEMVRIARELS